MNFELSPAQQEEYAIALLSATCEDDLMEAHKQFGQLDKYIEIVEARSERLRKQLQLALNAVSANLVATLATSLVCFKPSKGNTTP